MEFSIGNSEISIQMSAFDARLEHFRDELGFDSNRQILNAEVFDLIEVCQQVVTMSSVESSSARKGEPWN